MMIVDRGRTMEEKSWDRNKTSKPGLINSTREVPSISLALTSTMVERLCAPSSGGSIMVMTA